MTQPILAAFLSCKGTSLSDEEKFILEQSNPVGVTLFARNINNINQIKSLVNNIKETIGRDNVLIAVDQEGGRVRRLIEPDFHPISAAIEIGSLDIEKASTVANLHAEIVSYDMHKAGLNVNFAPVLDVIHYQTTEALKSRCFSQNVKTISILGKNMIDTYTKNGIIPCIKHMPGHGAAQTDPHMELPIINLDENELLNQLEPFRYCNNAPLGMTAHIVLPNFDSNNSITQSSIGIKKLIREAIGFKGLLISDAIDMKALKGTIVEKAQKSISAGCDCICYSLGNINDLQLLKDNCPKLSDTGTERLDKALKVLHNTNIVKDVSNIFDEYKKIVHNIPHYEETYDATEVLHQLQKEDE